MSIWAIYIWGAPQYVLQSIEKIIQKARTYMQVPKITYAQHVNDDENAQMWNLPRVDGEEIVLVPTMTELILCDI